MAHSTIYWYDFETFGDNPRRDRASQFAGIRTDEELNIIDDPLVIYCKPANDFLPSPMACLITGITPQKALGEGLLEAEFIKRIHAEFSQPNTCVAGYNSLRFDDEMTRQLLYRNFYDPYEREWRNGNSRWDIIDMMRLCAALRPEGINWPKKEDGNNSFRLDRLTVANGIEHGSAHDALADVIATIEMAKLVRTHQPRLFHYLYGLRDKRQVMKQMNLVNSEPFVHVSTMYPASQGCLALVLPLCAHPTNKNGVIAYDLRQDPNQWLHLSVEEIRQGLYTPKAQLPQGVERIALKTIHSNRCPVVAPAAVLTGLPAAVLADFEIDLQLCQQHLQQIKNDKNLQIKIIEVFSDNDLAAETDPDFMIYSGGFFSSEDKQHMQKIRGTKAVDLSQFTAGFRDSRLEDMLLRYRARNYPETLSVQELDAWNAYRGDVFENESNLARYNRDLDLAQQRAQSDKDREVLCAVEEYVESIIQQH